MQALYFLKSLTAQGKVWKRSSSYLQSPHLSAWVALASRASLHLQFFAIFCRLFPRARNSPYLILRRCRAYLLYWGMRCTFYILNHFLFQVVDIVRTNVRAILQRVWRASEVDNLRLCRVFSRVFNRLLWSHGQGLWNCFSNLGYVTLRVSLDSQ